MELPEGWKLVRLEDLIELKYGKGLSSNKRIKGDIPVFGSNGVVGYHNEPLIEFPTIVIGRKGSVGKVNIIKKPCWVIDTAFYTTIKEDELYLDYLYYYLTVIEKKLVFPKGVKPGINRKEYLNNTIPIPYKDNKPDLQKQKEIVNKIETLFNNINKAIELRQKAINETKDLFNSVLNKVFKDEEFELVRLEDEFIFLKKSKRRAREGKTKGKYPFITSSQNQTKFIDVADYNEESIIIGTGGQPSVHIFKEFSCSADNFIIGTKNKDIFQKYVFHYLYKKDELKKGFKGQGLKHLSKEYLKNLLIPIPYKDNKPDLQKQKEIAEYLDNLHNKIKKLEELQEKQLNLFKELKESILNKAFKGELV